MMKPDWPRRDRRKLDLYMLGQHFGSRRLVRSVFGGAAERIRDELHVGAQPTLEPVPTWDPEDARGFLEAQQQHMHPVVFKGAAKHWPAVQQWSPAFFRERCGDEQVRILYMAPEEIDAEAYARPDVPMREALDRLDEGNSAYLRFLPFLMQRAELRADLDLDWLEAHKGTRHPANLQLFIGGAGTATALHSAISANLFVQVHGRKRWQLFAPEWTHAFRPPVRRSLYFETAFDPLAPDYERYPLTRGLVGYEVELEAGDVLWNPPFWWHRVSNPTTSIGVGFRWMPIRQSFSVDPVLTTLTLFSVDPPILAAPLLDLDFTRMFSTRVLRRSSV